MPFSEFTKGIPPSSIPDYSSYSIYSFLDYQTPLPDSQLHKYIQTSQAVLKACTQSLNGQEWETSRSAVLRAIFLGMKNPSSVNYWQVVEAYSPEEKLLGYIAHLLKTANAETAERLFYAPNQEVWAKLLRSIKLEKIHILSIIGLLDTSRTILYEELEDLPLSSKDIRFYIPSLLDYAFFISWLDNGEQMVS